MAVSALALAVGYLVCRAIVASRLGRVAVAVRDAEDRMSGPLDGPVRLALPGVRREWRPVPRIRGLEGGPVHVGSELVEAPERVEEHRPVVPAPAQGRQPGDVGRSPGAQVLVISVPSGPMVFEFSDGAQPGATVRLARRGAGIWPDLDFRRRSADVGFDGGNRCRGCGRWVAE